jgi:hypothetical protein
MVVGEGGEGEDGGDKEIRMQIFFWEDILLYGIWKVRFLVKIQTLLCI